MSETVYFISDGGQSIKIGYSAMPSRRMFALRASSPVHITPIGTVPGTRAQEKAGTAHAAVVATAALVGTDDGEE